jgi:hypothetical protein
MNKVTARIAADAISENPIVFPSFVFDGNDLVNVQMAGTEPPDPGNKEQCLTPCDEPFIIGSLQNAQGGSQLQKQKSDIQIGESLGR